MSTDLEQKLKAVEAKEAALVAVLSGKSSVPDGVVPDMFRVYKNHPEPYKALDNIQTADNNIQGTILAIEKQKAASVRDSVSSNTADALEDGSTSPQEVPDLPIYCQHATVEDVASCNQKHVVWSFASGSDISGIVTRTSVSSLSILAVSPKKEKLLPFFEALSLKLDPAPNAAKVSIKYFPKKQITDPRIAWLNRKGFKKVINKTHITGDEPCSCADLTPDEELWSDMVSNVSLPSEVWGVSQQDSCEHPL